MGQVRDQPRQTEGASGDVSATDARYPAVVGGPKHLLIQTEATTWPTAHVLSDASRPVFLIEEIIEGYHEVEGAFVLKSAALALGGDKDCLERAFAELRIIAKPKKSAAVGRRYSLSGRTGKPAGSQISVAVQVCADDGQSHAPLPGTHSFQ